MDLHKQRLFAAWREHPLWGYEGSKLDQLQGHPPYVLGGRAAARQVRNFLLREIKLGELEVEAMNERARGSEWWLRYIEGPAEHELKDTLRLSVPRRSGETKEDYATRLDRIELAYRARLPEYERQGLTHDE